MLPQSKQRGFRRFFGSRLFLFTGLIIAMLFAFGFGRAYYQDYKVRQEIESLQQEVKGLETKKLESMEILKYVTSQAFVEEKARTELNMKKPGEQVLVVTNIDEGQQKINTSNKEDIPLKNPIKWWYYFTKHNLIIN